MKQVLWDGVDCTVYNEAGVVDVVDCTVYNEACVVME